MRPATTLLPVQGRKKETERTRWPCCPPAAPFLVPNTCLSQTAGIHWSKAFSFVVPYSCTQRMFLQNLTLTSWPCRAVLERLLHYSKHYVVGESFQQSVCPACGHESLLHARRYESHGGTSQHSRCPFVMISGAGHQGRTPASYVTPPIVLIRDSVALPRDCEVLNPLPNYTFWTKDVRLSNALSMAPPSKSHVQFLYFIEPTLSQLPSSLIPNDRTTWAG
jgi:hypothetical protein